MKSPAKKSVPTPRAARSRRIPARKMPRTIDAQFVALLRRKCVRAASVGALSAAGEAIPGLFRMLGLVFGELLDAQFLARIQRELVEETFALYGLKLPTTLHDALVNKVQFVGTGASLAGDALARAGVKRLLGRAGGMVASRVLPLASIATSALSNAAVTYAIGKRAQAVARLRDAPIRAMPDVVRAFTGIDERRVYAWSVAAMKDTVGLLGRSFGRFAATSLRKGARRLLSRA
jgi:uncharacterized protein (DUF697 family)